MADDISKDEQETDPLDKCWFNPQTGWYLDTQSRYFYIADGHKRIYHNFEGHEEGHSSFGAPEPEFDINSIKPTFIPEKPLKLVIKQSLLFPTTSLVIISTNKLNIGRDKDPVAAKLLLKEFSVSRNHAFIYFEYGSWFIVDIGSTHGTFVNDNRLSESKQSSAPSELKHLDNIKIGSSEIIVHLHTIWPCNLCLESIAECIIDTSPCIPIINNLAEEEVVQSDRKRKSDLNRLKRALNQTNHINEEYIDRASQRRLLHDDDGMNVRDFKRSVEKKREAFQIKEAKRVKPAASSSKSDANKEIAVDNKGHLLLQRMGWKIGEGLGSESTEGIIEPIVVKTTKGRTGLGMNSMK